jgi:hypothetical protein
MMLDIISQGLSRISLWWLRDLMMAHRTAAIVNLNTIKAGINGLITESDALKTVEASLDFQIQAIESLMQISQDD